MAILATDKLTTLGRWFVGFAALASGLQQILLQNFVRLVPKLPGWVPAQPALACLVGAVLVVAGVALLSGKGVRVAAAVLAAMLFLMFLFLCLPQALSNPLAGFMWTNPAKTLALGGGALLLAGMAPGPAPVFKKLMPLAPVFLGIFLLICGIQHFVYAGFVDGMVPAWIPPGRRFWTCFSATALLAGGVGVLLPKTARLAATWVAIMIFLWVILLHIPRAAADWNNAGETSAIFEAMALSGIGLLVAGSRPAGNKS